jgi:hypothetical protein
VRRLALGALVVSALAAGCAAWPFVRPATVMLAKADHLTQEGQYQEAVTVYDDFLTQYADDAKAPRALASRDVVAGFLSARAELARVRQLLAARDTEVARLREDLARVRQEADRLRTDLERLKQIDLTPDRRRLSIASWWWTTTRRSWKSSRCGWCRWAST